MRKSWGGGGWGGEGEGLGGKYEVNNERGYWERWGCIGNVYWNDGMFVGRGDGKYGDVVEGGGGGG